MIIKEDDNMAEYEKTDVLRDLEIDIKQNSDINERAVKEENEKLGRILLRPIYQAGIAETQEEYEKYYDLVFEALDELDKTLGQRKYLLGDSVTQADVRLYTVLVRFDIIYYFAFRLNRSQIKDFPNLWRYAKELYHRPEFKKATDFEKLKNDYYQNQSDIENPYHLVANGPDVSAWEDGSF